MSTTRSSSPAPTRPVVAAPTGYLHEVDVVRLLTFASVILVHSLSSTTTNASVGAGVLGILIHFTRETFFVLSAFVLFHVHYAKGLDARRFWRRRASTIVVPYLLWTLIYWTSHLTSSPFTSGHLLRLLHDVWSGDAKFHLYFLLVSMQLYLVLPLLVRLVRRTRGHHRALLIAALIWQVAVLSLLYWTSPTTGLWGDIRSYADTLLPTYLGYVVAGALAAVHLPAFHTWVTSHTRTVIAMLVAGAAIGELTYAAALHAGRSAATAAEPLQPVLIPLTAVISVALYALGAAYARRRRQGDLPRLGRVVATGSTISFGVYLMHPLVLQYAVPWLGLDSTIKAPLSTLIAWVLAAAVSTVLVLVISRTPASLALTGRHRQRRTPPAPRDPAGPATERPGAVTA